MQAFLQNGYEQINGDGCPDLGAHGVWAGAVKGFDAQMLLDPFEEQFDLPAAPIEMVKAGTVKLLVRKISVLPVSGSR